MLKNAFNKFNGLKTIFLIEKKKHFLYILFCLFLKLVPTYTSTQNLVDVFLQDIYQYKVFTLFIQNNLVFNFTTDFFL